MSTKHTPEPWLKEQKAYADGCVIQARDLPGSNLGGCPDWQDCVGPHFSECYEYRVKPGFNPDRSRIKACVEALDGLEPSAIAGAVKALEEVTALKGEG